MNEILSKPGAAETLPKALDVAQPQTAEPTAEASNGDLKTAVEVACPPPAPPAPVDLSPDTTDVVHRLKTKERVPHGRRLPELSATGKAQRYTLQTIQTLKFSLELEPSLGLRQDICGTDLVTAEEAKKLQQVEASMKSLLEQAKDYTALKANEDFTAMELAYEAKVVAGQVPPEPLPNREDFRATFQTRQRAIQKALAHITITEAAPMVRTVLARFETAAIEWMRTNEEAERNGADAWGLEYEPSQIWRAVANILLRYQPELRIPSPGNWALPSQMLEGLVEL